MRAGVEGRAFLVLFIAEVGICGCWLMWVRCVYTVCMRLSTAYECRCCIAACEVAYCAYFGMYCLFVCWIVASVLCGDLVIVSTGFYEDFARSTYDRGRVQMGTIFVCESSTAVMRTTREQSIVPQHAKVSVLDEVAIVGGQLLIMEHAKNLCRDWTTGVQSQHNLVTWHISPSLL